MKKLLLVLVMTAAATALGQPPAAPPPGGCSAEYTTDPYPVHYKDEVGRPESAVAFPLKVVVPKDVYWRFGYKLTCNGAVPWDGPYTGTRVTGNYTGTKYSISADTPHGAWWSFNTWVEYYRIEYLNDQPYFEYIGKSDLGYWDIWVDGIAGPR